MSISIRGKTIYGPDIVTDGLVLYLDAANPKSYSGSESVWKDLSGESNHCNWNNTPTFNSEGYFTFDGISNYGTITNNSTLSFSAEQTLIFWMRHSFTSGRRNPWNQAYGGYGTWTHENGSSMNWYFGDAGSDNTPYIGVGSPATIRDVWNCLGTTRNITNHRWYLNGIASNLGSHSYGELTITNANIRIGSGYAGYWAGDMSCIMAYSRFLTETEMSQNYNALKNRFNLQ